MTTTLTALTTAALNQDIATADAATSGSFVIDLQGNITETADLDAINLQSGVTLTIDGSNGSGGSYTLDGAGTFTGLLVDAGSSVTIENLDLSNSVSTLASGTLSGTVTISNNATIDQTAPVTFGDTSGPATIINEAGSVYDIAAVVDIAAGPVGTSQFINEGTLEQTSLEQTGASGISHVYVDVIDTGTLSVVDRDSNLEFDGPNNSFSGTYVGGGMIDYGGDSTDALGTIDMTEGACTTNYGTVNQSGVLTLSTLTTLTNVGGTWNFTTDDGLVLADPGQINNAAFFNYGTLAKSGGTGTTVIGCDLTNHGPISVASGTLAFNGPSNNFLLGAISGAGTFSLGGGGADEIDSGVSINSNGWTITDAGTDVTMNEALSYSGTFIEQSGATLTLSNNLTLNGPASFANAIVNGSGILATYGTTSIAGLTLASGAQWQNFGAATVDSGGTLVVSFGAVASGTTVANGGTIEILDGGVLAGAVANNGTVDYDIASSGAFSGTLTGSGTLVVSGGGHLDVVSAYTGAAQIDGTSTLEFSGPYVGAATFGGSSTGSGGTLKFDAGSTGPITVVNSNDTVIAQPGNGSWIDAAVSYTLPTNIDTLFLFAGAQGTGNSDAAGDALYALDTVNTQTLTGNSANDAFVVFKSSDVVVPKAGSHDVVYAAASFTLPTGVDALLLEGTAVQGAGNSDAAGDALYAANPGQVATLTGNSANDVFVVYNSADVVVPKAGSHDSVYSAVNYTLPTGVDTLFLEAGTKGVGNSDAAGDALYAADAGIGQTLTGNSANDTFVVYNSADVVVPKAGSHDSVYSAVNYTLPTGVEVLFLEAGTQAAGNSDAAGDVLYAADAGIGQTLTGHSHDDTFVVYNSGDTVIGQGSSTDTIYAAANFTLPTNVDALFLEGGASRGTGNGDAANTLFGNAGIASTLVAGGGADTLYVAGAAGTIMTGGTGHDTFAFPNVMGHDEVTNFGTPKDTLQFNATLFSNFSAAMNAASQVGANTVFTIDANDTVTLDNVVKSNLAASNFHFS